MLWAFSLSKALWGWATRREPYTGSTVEWLFPSLCLIFLWPQTWPRQGVARKCPSPLIWLVSGCCGARIYVIRWEKEGNREPHNPPAPSGRAKSPSRELLPSALESGRADQQEKCRQEAAGRFHGVSFEWTRCGHPRVRPGMQESSRCCWWETAWVRIEGRFLTLTIWDQNPVLSHASTSVGPMTQGTHKWAARRGSEHGVHTSAFQVLSKCLPVLDKDHSLVTKCPLFHSEEFPHNFL